MTNSSHNFITLEEFINVAFQFEVESAKFYRGLQKQVTREDVREILILLEKEEIKHQKILKEFDFGKDKDSMLQFLPSLSLSMPEMTTDTPGVNDIIELGIARERKAAEIYEHAASMLSGHFRELLEGLAIFERQHEERLLGLQTLL